MRYSQFALMVLVCAALMVSSMATATPTAGFIEDWSSPPSVEGWDRQDAVVSLSNPSGSLQIDFPNSGAPFPWVQEDTIFNNSASYTGDYSGSIVLSFRFNAVNALPVSSLIYMSATDGTEWTLPFTAVLGDWATISTTFEFSEGWAGGGAADFANDITQINAIGITIVDLDPAPPTGPNDYLLDDWQYLVPEPGTYCMLAVSFLSFGMAVRRRKS